MSPSARSPQAKRKTSAGAHAPNAPPRRFGDLNSFAYFSSRHPRFSIGFAQFRVESLMGNRSGVAARRALGGKTRRGAKDERRSGVARERRRSASSRQCRRPCPSFDLSARARASHKPRRSRSSGLSTPPAGRARVLAAHPFEKPQICRLQGDQHGLVEPVRGRGGVLSIIVKRPKDRP